VASSIDLTPTKKFDFSMKSNFCDRPHPVARLE